jgi:GLPGLI family protein
MAIVYKSFVKAKPFIGLVFVIFFNISFAQQIDGFIEYSFKHKYNKENKNLEKFDNFKLYFNEKLSVCKSKNIEDRDSLSNITNFPVNDEGVTHYDMSKFPTGIRTRWFTDLQDKKTKTIRKIDNIFIEIKDTSIVKWIITDENKVVLSKLCQKATTTFKGRKWEAWFTTEVPYSVGPWKLNGLPGAILFAYDRDNDVIFQANKIVLKKANYNFNFPNHLEQMTNKEYEIAFEKYRESFFNGENGIKIVENDNGGPKIIKPKETNPIELTD